MNQEAQEIVRALSKNLGDRFVESRLIPRLLALTNPRRRVNQKNSGTVQQRFMSGLAAGMSECLYWRGHIDALGYGRFSALGENKAHRVSWILHNGPIPKGMKVLHKCDVRNCVKPEHLFLGTQADNVRDMIEKGRDNRGPALCGEKNPMAALTAEQVEQIRQAKERGEKQNAIAKRFGVSPMTVSRIINRKTWK